MIKNELQKEFRVAGRETQQRLAHTNKGKKFFIFILFLIFCKSSSAQFTSKVWCFGDSAGIDFNQPIPQTFFSGIDTRGSCATICDSSGNLLFYAVCGNWPTWSQGNLYAGLVKNKMHATMDNGENLVGENWYRETLIVPMPNDTNLFYVFTAGVGIHIGLYYSIVDLSQNAGLGKVVSKNNQLLNFESCDGLSSIKHGNGRDWWVIYKKALINNNEFYKYLITPTGIDSVLIQSIGTITFTNNQRMTFNHYGNKLLVTNAAGLIELFDFDRCSGNLSNMVTINPETSLPQDNFRFAEFSPNDSLLYIVCGGTTDNLYQINLYAPNIFGSKVVIDSFNTIQYDSGDLKMGPDGVIYHSRAWYDGINFNYPYPDSAFNLYNMNLSVINQPNQIGLACDFQPFSFYLGGSRTYYGLPNNPDYELPRLQGSICDTVQWTGSPPALEGGAIPILQSTYVAVWQKLFVNAQNIKGKQRTLRIFSLDGKLVYQSISPHSGVGGLYFTQDVDVSNLSSGMYLISLTTEKESLNAKFMKE